jgi:hypothetical protein
MAASRARYSSAAFTSAWCSSSRPTMESCPFFAAHMSAFLLSLQKKRFRHETSKRHKVASRTALVDSRVKGALPAQSNLFSTALNNQKLDGIIAAQSRRCERSAAVPVRKMITRDETTKQHRT